MISRCGQAAAVLAASVAALAMLWVSCGLSEPLLRLCLGGGRATTEAHHDESRAAVGWTAFGVALLRAFESCRAGRRFVDPVAVRLFALRGGAPLGGRLAFAIGCPLFEPLLAWSPGLRRKHELVAVRTQFLDAAIRNALPLRRQLVTVGAGLDSRPFRMRDALQDTAIFEVDFPGMLAAKRRLFSASGFDYDELLHTQKQVRHVGVDLSLEGWHEALTAQGFDSATPALWLLEGLTGYLTEAELLSLLGVISRLSAPSSRLAATWLAPGGEQLTMHRFVTQNPSPMLLPLGWEEVQVQTLPQAASSLRGDAPALRGGERAGEGGRGGEEGAKSADIPDEDELNGRYLLSCHEKR